MDVDHYSLFLSLFISTVGFSYFLFGKKRSEYAFMLSGAVMMGFSYFVDSFWISALVGTVLAVIPFLMR